MLYFQIHRDKMKSPLLILLTVTLVSGQCLNDSTSEPVTTEKVTGLANGSSEFAVALFKAHFAKQQQSSTGNIFISPLSIWSALTLTYFGSEDQTATELGQALHVDAFDKKNIDKIFTVLMTQHLLHNVSSKVDYTFHMANKLYFDQSVQLQQCLAERLASDIERAEFATAPEEWRQKINQWVETQTNDKIKELLLKQNVGSNTRMVIVNAAYFKATWAMPFSKHTTTKEDFFTKPNQPIKVDMMKNQGSYFWGQSSTLGCSAIVLPYFGQDVSMIVLLPDTTVEDLIPKLTTKDLDDLYQNTERHAVHLSLPKFKIQDEMDLIETIQALDVQQLFSPGEANLSGFTKAEKLYVDFIRHKTFIDVNEDGTEAAAATAIGATRSGIPANPSSFVVNKPFVFVIRNNNVGSYLFMGVIREPKLQ